MLGTNYEEIRDHAYEVYEATREQRNQNTVTYYVMNEKGELEPRIFVCWARKEDVFKA